MLELEWNLTLKAIHYCHSLKPGCRKVSETQNCPKPALFFPKSSHVRRSQAQQVLWCVLDGTMFLLFGSEYKYFTSAHLRLTSNRLLQMRFIHLQLIILFRAAESTAARASFGPPSSLHISPGRRGLKQRCKPSSVPRSAPWSPFLAGLLLLICAWNASKGRCTRGGGILTRCMNHLRSPSCYPQCKHSFKTPVMLLCRVHFLILLTRCWKSQIDWLTGKSLTFVA